MSGILDEIISYKREYVKESKKKLPLKELEMLTAESPETREFTSALSGEGCSLIAEIKTASPSRGIIRDDISVEEVAEIYSENGAAAISVLTDEKYFKGSLSRLSRVRNVTGLPLLRKDFIIDEYQIFKARHAGADAILLITACLDDSELIDFMQIVHHLEMESLVEIHDETEMNRAGNLDARFIGINNRNLKTFETDIAITGKLAPYAPENSILVSESGLFNSKDVKEVHDMGADAFLVGEALMRESDIASKVRELSYAAR